MLVNVTSALVLGAFPSPLNLCPSNRRNPVTLPQRLHTRTTPYPHRYLTVAPLQTLQRCDGEVTVALQWGNGGERDRLGWACRPQSQPFRGNRVNQTQIRWRQGKDLPAASGCQPLSPDYDFS